MSEYAASMSLRSATAFVAVPGLSFTWRMNLPVPCNRRAGSGSACALEKSHVYVRREHIDVGKGRVSQTCGRTAVM